MYHVVKSSKEKNKTTILRADRNVLQRLIIAYEAGLKVDLHSVLKYELMPVPVSLTEMNGSLRTGQESAKMKEFVEQRLPSVSQQQQDRSSEVRFWDTMHKNNALTIDNLYQVVKSSKGLLIDGLA